jgi:hypothetical protein
MVQSKYPQAKPGALVVNSPAGHSNFARWAIDIELALRFSELSNLRCLPGRAGAGLPFLLVNSDTTVAFSAAVIYPPQTSKKAC